MSRGFIQSVLSTQKQRQRFYWVRNMISFFCGVATFYEIGGVLGGLLALAALVVAYFTIAPVLAFIACLFEQMYS